MARRQALDAWMRANLRATDGPQSGRRLRLEPWQSALLRAIDRERRPIVAVRAASQVGKTMLMLGVAMKAAIDGRGAMLASATEVSIRDLGRRLDTTLEAAPELAARFPSPRSGPGARASWKQRQLDSGGWLALAAAGSASQLASRTAAVAVADETARWPLRVRSGEGHPVQILRARLLDWGADGRLIAISSPVHPGDSISTMFQDGDRRRLEYSCPACRDRTPFAWEQVIGRERGETPSIACARCGELHDESARRKMLRTARWTPQRAEPVDEDLISFTLSRLDSGRASLDQVTAEWRRSRLAVERGDPQALRAFRNMILGLPAESGAADVDALHERRGRRLPEGIEQCCAGVDVQTDRLVFAVLGFGTASREVWALDHGEILGDPRDTEPWQALAAHLAAPFAGLPVSVTSVDAGYLPTSVKRECQRRRWWIPTIGRSGAGIPIARKIGAAGSSTGGKDDLSAWWSGRVAAGRVHLPADISRQHVAELCAAEALTAEGGALRWRPIDGRQNHRWDAALLAVHARHFRTLTSSRRPMRLIAV